MSNFAAPPQWPSPSDARHSPPSQWPTVLGSIAIAFGAIGALMALWGLVSTVITSAPGMPAGMALSPELKVFTIVDSMLGLVFAGMLIAGGIGTLRRRARGVKVLRIYAIVRLALVIPLTVTQGIVTHRVVEQTVAAMESAEADASAEAETDTAPAAETEAGATKATGTAEAPAPAKPAPATSAKAGGSAPPIAAMKQVMMVGAVGGTVCGGLLAAVWPTVLLVLLGNGRRKDEVAQWPHGL